MAITITVDTRERAKNFDFFDAVKKHTDAQSIDATVVRKQIDYGDFIVEGPDVIIVIERKTHGDMASPRALVTRAKTVELRKDGRIAEKRSNCAKTAELRKDGRIDHEIEPSTRAYGAFDHEIGFQKLGIDFIVEGLRLRNRS